MIGYKAFDKDLSCKEFQYEVGKTYEMAEMPKICERGFHFCKTIIDCYDYYPTEDSTRICKVEALGYIDTEDGSNKFCTNKIKILEEITDVNIKKANVNFTSTGYRNTGDWNTGNCNTGHRNTGNRNTGDWNSTDYSTGIFNTNLQPILMFNKPSDWTYADWVNSKARHILDRMPQTIKMCEWISHEEMSNEEKKNNPTYKTTGGYLKVYTHKANVQEWWDKLDKADKECILGLPNFDKAIFKEITGIEVG